MSDTLVQVVVQEVSIASTETVVQPLVQEVGVSVEETVVNVSFVNAQGLPGIQGSQGLQGIPGVKGDKGDRGDQGIPGAAGGTSFVFDQAVPTSTWLITHNLGRYPSITVVDSAGSQVYGDAVYISDLVVRVEFSAAFSGKAYLN